MCYLHQTKDLELEWREHLVTNPRVCLSPVPRRTEEDGEEEFKTLLMGAVKQHSTFPAYF